MLVFGITLSVGGMSSSVEWSGVECWDHHNDICKIVVHGSDGIDNVIVNMGAGFC